MNSVARTSVKEAVARGIARRYRNELIFRALGLTALLIGLGFLGFFFYTLIGNGYTAFRQTRIALEITIDSASIDPDGTRDAAVLETADYQKLVPDALSRAFPEVTSRQQLRELFALLSPGAGVDIKQAVREPSLIGTSRTFWLLANDDVDVLEKGHVSRALPPNERRLSDAQLGWLTKLEAADQGRSPGSIAISFSAAILEIPSMAGIWSATVGSFPTCCS